MGQIIELPFQILGGALSGLGGSPRPPRLPPAPVEPAQVGDDPETAARKARARQEARTTRSDFRIDTPSTGLQIGPPPGPPTI